MGPFRALGGVFAFAVTCSAALTSPSVRHTATTTGSAPSGACALASSASASFASASPSAPAINIPAELAYNCLKSIPNHKGPALDLMYALEPLLKFQSTIPYLKLPPVGYLYPPIDFEAGVAEILANVENGKYESEYDFQNDISALLISARDGHLTYTGDTGGIFQFQRSLSLVSVSADGFGIPYVFASDDLVTPVANGASIEFKARSMTFVASPVISIDGIDAVTFLIAQSLVNNIQDPDASYNFNFFELAQFATNNEEWFGRFVLPEFYPGPETVLTFANGTSRTVPNQAQVLKDLTGISTGDDVYSAFLPGPSAAATSGAAKRAAKTTAAAPPSVPTVPGYPFPVVKHSQNVVSGYFLNETGYQDVAVLSINSYGPEGNGSEIEFQSVVQKFLADATKANKKKLIVDLQANPGGVIDLGTDTFAQLFPHMRPNTQGNEVSNVGQDFIGRTLSNIEAAQVGAVAEAENLVAQFTVQATMHLDNTPFKSWDDFIGPVQVHGGEYTKLFQLNYTNPAVTDGNDGIIITGTGNRTDFKQPFAAEDIILLYDGFCASTCTIFSELMKTLGGVQSIAVGGRPLLAAMQGVGGVKGSQVEEFPSFIPLYQAVEPLANKSLLASTASTVFSNISDLVLTRAANPAQAGSVNYKNNIRIGDTSLTPLQFVYEAADCRLWYTPQMLYDITYLWRRVADVAFNASDSSKPGAGRYDSPYCVEWSTGHPTSLSGGLRNGTLGWQAPPPGVESKLEGWAVGGNTVEGGSEGTGAGGSPPGPPPPAGTSAPAHTAVSGLPGPSASAGPAQSNAHAELGTVEVGSGSGSASEPGSLPGHEKWCHLGGDFDC